MKINIMKNFNLDKVKTMGVGVAGFVIFFMIMLFSIRAYPDFDKEKKLSNFKKTNLFMVFLAMFAGVMVLLFIYYNRKIWKDEVADKRFKYALMMIIFLFVLFTNLRYYLILITITLLVLIVYIVYKVFGEVIGEGFSKLGELASKITNGSDEVQ